MEITKVDRNFWLLVLMMYCFPQIASEKSGCIPDGWVDRDNIIIIIHSLHIGPFLMGLKPQFLRGRLPLIQD